MENSNLRSLEAWDRPLGTERSVLPSPDRSESPDVDFAADVDRARARCSTRPSREGSRRRTREDDEPRVRRREEPEETRADAGREIQVAPEPAPTALPPEGRPGETAEPTDRSSGSERARVSAPEAPEGDAPAAEAVPAEETPIAHPSRAAIEMGQAQRASTLAAPSAPGGSGAPLPEALDAAGVPGAASTGEVTAPEAAAAATGESGEGAADPEPFGRPAAERPAAPAEHNPPAPERGFEVARVTDRRAPRVEPPPPPSPSDRPLPPERAADVLRQVRMHLSPGLREATLRLQPAWLGRITIRIAVRDGRTAAELRAENKSTLEALERHVPELRAALEQQGFAAGELELHLGLEGGAAEDRREFSAHQGAGRTVTITTPERDTSPQLERIIRPLSESGVDTYA